MIGDGATPLDSCPGGPGPVGCPLLMPKDNVRPDPAPSQEPAMDRRRPQERRQTQRRARKEPVAQERRSGDERRRGERRKRNINQYDMSPDELEFVNAVNRFRELSSNRFPSARDILNILRDLGYEKNA